APRRGAAPSPSPGSIPQPAAETAPRPDGLPRRVRQASLAHQLRESAADRQPPAPVAGGDVERDAEQVRSRMASMQRGWQRGRRHNAEEAGHSDQATGPGETAPRTTSEGDGR
ncbi:MAG TPA: histidine kinase, partial [Streptomyces sp.]|nr:histidine kinase [Streptomyces sp.]